MQELTEKDIFFSRRSLMDPDSRVFFFQDRIFRAIYNYNLAFFYIDLLEKDFLNLSFRKGLVKTWICNDIKLIGVPLILEHEKVSFVTLPCEWTDQMFWQAVKMMVDINLELSHHGLILKDAHLFNVFFHFGSPIFIDFCSIIQSQKISDRWIDEFITYAAVPLWISKTQWHELSIEYRREHTVGFGINFFKRKIIKSFLFKKIIKLKKISNNPFGFFEELTALLEKYRPLSPEMEKWASYDQSHSNDFEFFNEAISTLTTKQRFVYNIFKKEKPRSVLDCAANKGYYAEMAADFGASVLAFDKEFFCVDKCRGRAEKRKKDITSIVMDFQRPTPSFGHGLVGEDAFKRFKVDIVLSLGLIHHLCLKGNFPVRLFCEICINYANEGVILEFVEIEDKHVANWEIKSVPIDYNIKNIIVFFSKKFPFYYIVKNDTDGLCRKLIYFSRKE